MWRTMFSRTTMASSISMPMASERPIRVRVLSVKPNTCMTVKEAITAIGRVRPVMTVERQEFRNTNTTSTVSSAPRAMVTLMSWIESRMKVESSRMTDSRTPAGSSFSSRAMALRTLSERATVLAPDCFWTSTASVGAVSRKARFLGSSTPSTTWARSRTRSTELPRVLTGISATSAAVRARAATRTMASVAPRSAEPAGTSTFSLRSAPTTSSSETR